MMDIVLRSVSGFVIATEKLSNNRNELRRRGVSVVKGGCVQSPALGGTGALIVCRDQKIKGADFVD